MGCLLDDLRAFVIYRSRQALDDCSPGRGGIMALDGTTRRETERLKAKWIAAEKARAGLRHAVV